MTSLPSHGASHAPDSDAGNPSLDEHVGGLGRCVDPVAAGQARAAVQARLFGDPLEPVMLGRFEVLRRLGAGGMGVVYLARDPELEREVAIKLIRGDLWRHEADVIDRARAEARAMARLAHPNVVPVHEIGVAERGVFIVMEYVPGHNLRAWRRERPRTTAEILQVFLAAGQGLAAAHRVGLVHRDFKPDNLLLGEDGGVRVADFGLAKLVEAGALRGASPAAPLAADGSAMAGTPAYMAPEQFLGRPADARTDQYAFCVTLYEALFGRRPWEDRAPEARGAASIERDITALPGRAGLARRVQRALLRGLAHEPTRRHPTMSALLAELAPAPSRRRSFVTAAFAGAGLAAGLWSGRPDPSPCAAVTHGLVGVWDGATRDEVAARPAAKTPPTASAVRLAAGRLDAYASAWATMRTETCEASVVRHEQSPELFDRRMTCLDDALRQIAAVSEFLRTAEPQELAAATSLTAQLPPLERCADSEALLAVAARSRDPAVRAKIDAIDAELTRDRVALETGQHRSRYALMRGLQGRVEALGDPILASRYWRGRAFAEQAVGDLESEQRSLGRALAAGWDARDDEALAWTWKDLAWSLGVTHARPAEGLLQLDLAELAARKLRGAVATDVRMSILNTRGNILLRQDDPVGAAEMFTRALRLADDEHWPGDTTRIRTYLAHALFAQQRIGDALAEFERALATAEAMHGKEHRRVAIIHYNLAVALQTAERYEESRSHLDRAETLFTAIHGREHHSIAQVNDVRGTIASDLNDPAAAYAAYTRAHEIRRRVLPPDHIEQALARYNLGRTAVALGRVDEGGALLRHALVDYEKRHGGVHPNVAMVLTSLGSLAATHGERASALHLLGRAADIADRTLPAADPRRLDAHIHHALLALDADQPDKALAEVDISLAALGGAEVDAVRRQSLRFLRARALYGLGKRAEGRQLAHEVLAASASGQHFSGLRAEVQGWLARPSDR